MKTSSHTPEQIIKIIEQTQKGEQSIAAICRQHGIKDTIARRLPFSQAEYPHTPTRSYFLYGSKYVIRDT